MVDPKNKQEKEKVQIKELEKKEKEIARKQQDLPRKSLT